MQDKNAKPRRLGGPGRYRPPRGAAKRESAPSHHGADPLDELPLIWGMHSVEAALANPERRIVRAWLTENAAHRMAAALAQRNVTVEGVSPKDLDRRLGAETVHQGALLEVEPLPDVDLRALAETAASRGPLIVLDQVTDPHNVGAILRSGAVFGASGLVMTARHSAPLGGVRKSNRRGENPAPYPHPPNQHPHSTKRDSRPKNGHLPPTCRQLHRTFWHLHPTFRPARQVNWKPQTRKRF